MMKKQTALLLTLLVFAMLMINSCAPVGVKPWERDIMAKPSMQLDNEAVDRGLDDHIYFSKEASSGGRGFGGGGCGCN